MGNVGFREDSILGIGTSLRSQAWNSKFTIIVI